MGAFAAERGVMPLPPPGAQPRLQPALLALGAETPGLPEVTFGAIFAL